MVVVKISNSDDTEQRIKELSRNLQAFENNKDSIIYLTSVQGTTPLSLLPLAVLTAKITKSPHHLQNIIPPDDQNVNNYLNVISFPNGITKYRSAKYAAHLPILHFDIEKLTHDVKSMVETALNKYQELLSSVIKKGEDGIVYFFNEIITNIYEHSGSKNLWIFVQLLKKKEEVEICVIDEGVGFKEAYKKAGIDMNNDIDAIRSALEGKSSKKEEDGRGWGIRSTKRIITESDFNGEFVIITGKGGYYFNKNYFFDFPIWQGTIVMARIKKPKEKVEIYRYVE